ncbi:MAG: hypothetical protein KA354_20665 [Phycisphaerae bacterium]|nr:hypothetical protein [Phycisphaerae bacterium]
MPRPNRSSVNPRLSCLAAMSFCIPVVCGCSVFKAIAIASGEKTEKVDAEFSRLPAKKTLIYVWAPIEIKWDYPHIRLELAKHLAAYLKTNVKDFETVEPEAVEKYLEKSRSPEVDPVELGKHFQVDVVIHLSLYQFSLRDPGMAHFYRGRMYSSVEVHDLTKGDPAERIPLREVKVVCPEEKEIGFTNVRADQVRQRTYEMFTAEVGKKFHEYERQLD